MRKINDNKNYFICTATYPTDEDGLIKEEQKAFLVVMPSCSRQKQAETLAGVRKLLERTGSIQYSDFVRIDYVLNMEHGK